MQEFQHRLFVWKVLICANNACLHPIYTTKYNRGVPECPKTKCVAFYSVKQMKPFSARSSTTYKRIQAVEMEYDYSWRHQLKWAIEDIVPCSLHMAEHVV